MAQMSHTVLKAALSVLLLGTLFGQAVAIPVLAADMARQYPEVAYLKVPYAGLAIAMVACTQVGLIAIWVLLSKVSAGGIFSAEACRWVSVIIAAGIAGTALVLTMVLHLIAFVGDGGPTILYLIGMSVFGAAFVLLMVVMRGLLQTATSFSAELAEVV